MAKFYGDIGFAIAKETSPGIWEEEITERKYYGDVTKSSSRFQSADKINDDITFNNTISIVADPYANENFQYMKYVNYMGTKWKITNAEIQYPRIILTIGGMYNEFTTKTSE